MNDNPTRHLAQSLLFMRLTVFLVMFVWTVDKFLDPSHAMRIFDYFYGIGGVTDTVVFVMGALQMALVLAFVAGFRKRVSYGLVMLMHAGSTLSSWRQYMDPFDNLLFFAAWPMLGACVALYLLRDSDTLLSVDH
jgi:hypothetical protein